MKDKRNKQPVTRRERPTGRDLKGADTRHAPREDGSERIAKRLARAGVASRREAEAMVEAGRVAVNGKVLRSPAFNVTASDRIEIDGAPIPVIERTRLFLFHKPAGVVTTNRDPQGRRTIFDVLPGGLPRLMTVGRLDINTEGLLLLTNDGGLARTLELPATGWLRRYRVRVHGKVDAAALEGLSQGIAVDGTYYGAIEATLDREQGSNAWLTIGLREGKNREVKNVLGALGLDVTRLIRVSYGPFQLGVLAEGAVQEIKGKALRDQLGERLIEQAGANFDAPVAKPFSNKPVRAQTRPSTEDAVSPEQNADGAVKKRVQPNRKRQRLEKEEEMRGRLQTRPDRPPKRASRVEEPRRSRASNVWMAPGARPAGKKKREAEDEAQRKPGPQKRDMRRSNGKPDARPASSRRPGGISRRGDKGPKR